MGSIHFETPRPCNTSSHFWNSMYHYCNTSVSINLHNQLLSFLLTFHPSSLWNTCSLHCFDFLTHSVRSVTALVCVHHGQGFLVDVQSTLQTDIHQSPPPRPTDWRRRTKCSGLFSKMHTSLTRTPTSWKKKPNIHVQRVKYKNPIIWITTLCHATLVQSI